MIRLFIIGFLVLTAIYLGLVFYSRSLQKARLELEWENGKRDMDRHTFVEQGLKEYETSLRARLLFGVYVVPIVIVVALIYITNYM